MSASRMRKQRFPRAERRKALVGDSNINDDFIVDEQNYFCPPSKRPHITPRTDPSPPPPQVSKTTQRQRKESDDRNNHYALAPRLDKRARDEHNEQERSRRRELAVIYELIRSSFSQDDLRHLEPGVAPKSIEKLSYPQVLQVAHSIMLEEAHHIKMYERALQDIRYLEKELSKAGVTPPPRPNCPLLSENYRKVISIVESILRTDKIARNGCGLYEMSPSDRATYGDQQLSFVRSRHQHVLSVTQDLFSPSERRNPCVASRRHSAVARYGTGMASHAHSHSYQNSRPAVSSGSETRNLRLLSSTSSSQTNNQSQNSNGSVASLEDLEDLELQSIVESYDLFQNPLEEPFGHYDPVDVTFGLLPDL
ncbi:hypothetical protein Ciccas_007135 [Cichlidogyrus casuarinus]|uniref:BHLH domain-containing protein n=1 Tax=Cichlidogyrus casuarinus TaxID=1844966 RepID=A0ABD2Q3Q7_9PLAT